MAKFNRRKVIKSIGAAAGAGAVGVGTVQGDSQEKPVSEDEVNRALQSKEIKAALDTADVQPRSLGVDEAVEQEVNSKRWVKVPVDGDAEYLAYCDERDTAEIKTSSSSVVKATLEDDGVLVEDLQSGEEITAEALNKLENSDNYDKALQNGDVKTVKTSDATANFDRESETMRVVAPAELQNGDDVMLLVEIADDDSLEAVHGIPSPSKDEITIQDNDGIECWAGCIGFGLTCSNVCTPCVSFPTIPTCTPCGVCVSVTAGAACARECDIPTFW